MNSASLLSTLVQHTSLENCLLRWNLLFTANTDLKWQEIRMICDITKLRLCLRYHKLFEHIYQCAYFSISAFNLNTHWTLSCNSTEISFQCPTKTVCRPSVFSKKTKKVSSVSATIRMCHKIIKSIWNNGGGLSFYMLLMIENNKKYKKVIFEMKTQTPGTRVIFVQHPFRPLPKLACFQTTLYIFFFEFG